MSLIFCFANNNQQGWVFTFSAEVDDLTGDRGIRKTMVTLCEHLIYYLVEYHYYGYH
jgi:hypothetical protein